MKVVWPEDLQRKRERLETLAEELQSELFKMTEASLRGSRAQAGWLFNASVAGLLREAIGRFK